MVGTCRCEAEARERSVHLSEVPLMGEIIRYNEIDCGVMMGIIP